MQGPVLLRGPHLEAGLVAGDGRKVVPDPPNHLLGLLDAAKVVRQDGLVGLQLRGGERGVLHVPARADEEDVAEADLGALGREAGLQVGEGDGRRLEAVEVADGWVGLLCAPAGEID